MAKYANVLMQLLIGGVKVAGADNASINLTTDTNEPKPWADYPNAEIMPGWQSADGTIAGGVENPEQAGGYDLLFDAWQAKELVACQYSMSPTSRVYSGYILITNLKLASSNDGGPITFDMSFKFSGPVVGA